jgi:hypothetical protein
MILIVRCYTTQASVTGQFTIDCIDTTSSAVYGISCIFVVQATLGKPTNHAQLEALVRACLSTTIAASLSQSVQNVQTSTYDFIKALWLLLDHIEVAIEKNCVEGFRQ